MWKSSTPAASTNPLQSIVHAIYSTATPSSSGMLGQELEDQVRNLVCFFVQREMPSVEQVDSASDVRQQIA